MTSVQASPGKENLTGAVALIRVKQKPIDISDLAAKVQNEPSDTEIVIKEEAIDMENFIVDPTTEKDLAKNMHWVVEKVDKFEGTEPAGMFDALGAAGPVIRALKTNLSLAYALLKENDIMVANGSLNPLAGLQQAYTITSAAERLIKATSSMLTKITAACTVTASFEELAAPLADFVDYLPKLKPHKFSTSDLIELVCQLLKKMQDCSSGPHDSSLLSATEKLFMACLISSNAKLRTGCISMWNKTFGNSKDLQYSDKLRQVLVVISKKVSIFLPGLSVDLICVENKVSTPHKILSTRKRPVASLLDEDSVEYVPIQKTDSAKKKKLTDHQKECFSTTREQIPYMDEDSTQFKTNVLSRIGAQYEIETSSQSASTSAVQKARTAAQTTEAVFKSPADKEPAPSVEVAKETSHEEKKDEEQPKKRRGRPPKGQTKPVEEKSPESSNSSEGKRRSARRSLALSPEEKKKQEKEPEEVVALLSDSASESSQDAITGGGGGRSRRSKGTPSKYVPKVRSRGSSTAKTAGSPAVAAAKKTEPVKDKKNNNVDEKTEEEDSEILTTILAESKKNNKTSSKTPVSSEEDPLSSSSSIRELSPVGNTLVTPTKSCKKEEAVHERPRTPGILKKTGTPSTLDKKKMRVHFTQDVALREEERNAAVTTPKRSSKKIDAFLLRKTPTAPLPPAVIPIPSQAAVFPTLANDTEPITKIIDQLTPVKTPSAAALLRKQLTKKNITTVGELAATSESVVSTLPVKLNTVKCVLQKYAQILRRDHSPVQEHNNDETPVTKAPVLVPQILSSPSAVSRVYEAYAMETEELKTLDFSPVKVIETAREQAVGIVEEQPPVVVETERKEEETERGTVSKEQVIAMLDQYISQTNLNRDDLKELITRILQKL